MAILSRIPPLVVLIGLRSIVIFLALGSDTICGLSNRCLSDEERTCEGSMLYMARGLSRSLLLSLSFTMGVASLFFIIRERGVMLSDEFCIKFVVDSDIFSFSSILR